MPGSCTVIPSSQVIDGLSVPKLSLTSPMSPTQDVGSSSRSGSQREWVTTTAQERRSDPRHSVAFLVGHRMVTEWSPRLVDRPGRSVGETGSARREFESRAR